MNDTKDTKMGVMGLGWVGGTLADYLDKVGYPVLRYDPPKGLGSQEELAEAEVIFVCVPTPYVDGVGFDDSIVDSAISDIPGEKIVVIKSTVLPGTTDKMQKKYPQHYLLFNPEFLREVTAERDMAHPDRQIIGYTERSKEIALRVLDMLPQAPFMHLSKAKEAETVKYFSNCFLAMKVVFANQVYDLCEKMGVDYDEVRECAVADPRIGDSHLQVAHGEHRGYGGHCFPKDVKAFIQVAKQHGVDMTLLEKADELNEEIKKKSGGEEDK